MIKDRLRLSNITFYGYHGVHEHEREFGRPMALDVELTLDLSEAGRTDNLEQGLDYSEVYKIVRETEAAGPYKLLEALAEAVARQLLAAFPQVREVLIRARKKEPSVGGWVEQAEVEITRTR
jgi:7,8-dihydroneopterin aldolase/epimerase/oxygenase